MKARSSLKKKFLIALAAVIVVLAIGLAVFNSLLGSESFKGKITAMLAANVKQYTGMNLIIKGPFTVSVFPSLGISVSGLSLQSQPGLQPSIPLKSLAVDEARITVGPLSLLGGDVQIKMLDLHTVNAQLPAPQGQHKDIMLSFTRIALSDLSRNRVGEAKVTGKVDGPYGQFDIDADLEGGLDGEKLFNLKIAQARLTVSLPGWQPLELNARGGLSLEAAVPLSQLENPGQISRLRCRQLGLSLAGLKLTADGDFNPKSYEGQFSLNAKGNPLPILKLAGYEPSDASAAQELELSLKLKGHGQKIDIDELVAKLDGMALTLSQGSLNKDGLLVLNGTLALGELNLDGYLPKPGHAAPAQPNISGSQNHPAEPSRTLAILAGADAKLEISADKLGMAGHNLSQLKGTLTGHKQKWHLDPFTALYGGGTLNLVASADLSASPPLLTLNGRAENVELNQVTATVNGKLTNAKADITAQATDKPLHTMNGSASFLAGGITRTAFNLPAPLSSASPGTTVETVKGSFKIHNGLAHTSDLHAVGNMFEGSGGGVVDLPAQRLALDVVVQMGGLAINGITKIPLKVSGPIANPGIAVDAAQIAENAARGIIETPANVGSGVGNVIRGLPGMR